MPNRDQDYEIHLSNTSIERIFENQKNGIDQYLTQMEAETMETSENYFEPVTNETGGLFLDVGNPDWYL